MRKYVESKLTQQKQYEPKRPRFNFLRGLWTGTSNDRRMNGTSEWFIQGLLMKCKFLDSSCSKIGFFNPAEKSLSIGEMQPKPTHLSSD